MPIAYDKYNGWRRFCQKEQKNREALTGIRHVQAAQLIKLPPSSARGDSALKKEMVVL